LKPTFKPACRQNAERHPVIGARNGAGGEAAIAQDSRRFIEGNLFEVPVIGGQEISEPGFWAKLLHGRNRGLPRSKALLLAIGVGLLITP
jgi:hypothetical protein